MLEDEKDTDTEQTEDKAEVEVEIIPEEESSDEVQAEGAQKEEKPEQKRGKRAERRIRGLVKDKNTLTSALTLASEQLQAVRAENAGLTVKLKKNQEGHTDEIGRRLEAEETRLKTANTLAAEQEDQEALFDIRGRQAAIAAERVALDTFKREEEAVEIVADPAPAQPDARPLPIKAVPDEKAEDWFGDNDWFQNPASQSDRIKRSGALEIHKTLMEEGFVPTEQPQGGNERNEYYMELDKRLASEFQGGKPASRTAPSTPVVGGSRTPAGGNVNKVRLTQSEFELVKRMGISPQAYAREKAKEAADSGGT